MLESPVSSWLVESKVVIGICKGLRVSPKGLSPQVGGLMLSPGRLRQIELNCRTPNWRWRIAWWFGGSPPPPQPSNVELCTELLHDQMKKAS